MSSLVNYFRGLQPSVLTLYYVCIALAVASLILGLLLVININAVSALKRRYESFMFKRGLDGVSVQQLIENCLDAANQVESSLSSLDKRIKALEEQMPLCFKKMAVIRYNPFDDTGGDLSFVIALLNEANNGVVLNGIYNRGGSYTYAKRIENGIAVKHKLSNEEEEALKTAINSGRPASKSSS